MQAIEFETRLNNGAIHLPATYQHWQEGRQAKVIILVSDDAPTTGKDINRHAGTITLTEDPLTFQKAIRDEWT